MIDFNERKREQGLTETRLEREIYLEGRLSEDGDKNPYSRATDIRSYCLWAAGISGR